MRNMDEEYCINIRNALTFREGTVRVDAAGNLLSLAVLSEGFYRELLNTLMGWDLINANSEEQNAPGIDLIDRNKKIAVQVSLTCDHEKVQRSIVKFKAESYDGWHFFFVPIRQDAPCFRKDFSLPKGLEFDEAQDVLSTDRIMRIIEQDAGIEQKHTISLLMDKYTKGLPAHEALCKRLYCRLIYTREHHPSFRMMSQDGIDKLLFPYAGDTIPVYGSVEGNVAPIWQLIKAEHREGFRHVIIEGDGGIGKSVSLLSVTDDSEMLTSIPAIYIHMYELVYDNQCLTLPDYLAHYADHNEIDALCREGGDPKLMLLLDGLNEVAFEHQNVILRSIKQWSSGHPGAQLIITSRPIPGRHLEDLLDIDPLHISLRGLKEEQVRERLTAWEIPRPIDGAAIWETLKLPLFLTLYAKTARLPGKTPDGYPLAVREVTGQASLIWNYLQREMLREQEGGWPVSCAIACEFIAPYIAYQMAMKNTFELGHDEAEDFVEDAVRQIDLTVLPAHLKKVNAIRRHDRKNLPETDWVSFVLEQSGIFVAAKHGKKDKGQEEIYREEAMEDEYAFMHQNFRDCLAGLWLVNQAQMAKQDEIPEIWERSQSHLALNYSAELMEPKDYEKLWDANRKQKQYASEESRQNHTATCNLLELWKRNEKLTSELSFSGMDLRGLSLTHYLGKDGPALPLFRNPSLTRDAFFDRSVFESEGHTEKIRTLTVLPDGRVVSGASDNTLRVWDAATGHCLQTLKGHTESVICATFLKDGRVISGSLDQTLRVWDTATGQCLRILKGHEKSVLCVAALPDGRVVSGSHDRTLRVWDASTGKCLNVLSGHDLSVNCVIALSDERVVSGSSDKTMRVWDVAKGRCLHSLDGHTDIISCVAVSPNGHVVSGSYDNTLRIWDVSTGRCLRIMKKHTRGVTCVATFPDGRVVSGAYDNALRVWDTTTGECQKILTGQGSVTCVVVLSDRSVVSGSDDNTIRVWDIATAQCIQTLEGHSQSISCLAVLSDGRVVSGSNDNTLRVWDTSKGQCLQSMSHLNWIYCVTSLQNGWVVSGSNDNILRVWDPTTGQCLQTLEGHRGRIYCVATLPDDRVVSGSYDKTLRVWNPATGECLQTLKGHSSCVSCVATFSDGRIVSGADDNTLRVWDTSTGQCLLPLEGHTKWVRCVAVFPDGRVVSGSYDGTLRIWDAATGECLNVSDGNTQWIRCVAVLPDGRVISGGDDGTLVVWNVTSRKKEEIMSGHSGKVFCIAVHPDGRVVTGSEDTTLRKMDISSNYNLCEMYGHRYQVSCVTITSNGLVVSGSWDNTLRVWDDAMGECQGVLEAMEVRVAKAKDFRMDFSEAKLTDSLARLLWHNGAMISNEDYEKYVKPFRKAYNR